MPLQLLPLTSEIYAYPIASNSATHVHTKPGSLELALPAPIHHLRLTPCPPAAGALPAIPGLAGPSSSAAVQADVDAFLRGAVGRSAAGPLPDFQEFESIYGAVGRGAPPLPGAAALAPGRVELGHFLQVGLVLGDS